MWASLASRLAAIEIGEVVNAGRQQREQFTVSPLQGYQFLEFGGRHEFFTLVTTHRHARPYAKVPRPSKPIEASAESGREKSSACGDNRS